MIAVEFVNEEELRTLISLAAVGEALLDHGVQESWVYFYDALDEYMSESQYNWSEPFEKLEDLVDARMTNYKYYKDYVMLLPKEDTDGINDDGIDNVCGIYSGNDDR